MSFKKLNNIVGWFVFLIATIVYFLTLEPTVSWWDCGEYISTAYKLQVGHPPGAPLFQMIGRFFSLFAFGDVTKVALMINAMSALCSSFTILFLFWTISLLAKKIWLKDGEDSPMSNKIAVLAASAIGALAYTFSDSFWFSAVEGEVYAMSSLFTAITFWAILKWEEVADQPYNYRWIILIAYLIGLSIGVHLLNLLCIPAVVYVVYFKKYKKVTFKGFVIAGIISVALVGFIQVILVPAVVSLCGKFELFFVNTLGAPFNLGTLIYFIILISLIVLGIYFTTKYKKVMLNTVVLSFMFILIGYSSFFMLVIRANANTPINENEPSEAVSMLSYLKREQYGSWPLVYGPYYMAKPYDANDGSPVYVRDEEKGKYVITDYRRGTDPIYDDNVMTIFPRMWNGTKRSYTSTYEQYIDKSKMIPVSVKKSDGSVETILKPTFMQNLKFFIGYQCNHMYWRYFMWNFVGRQNDIQGHGEIENGNWISGIKFIDNARLGDQSDLPKSMTTTGRTAFYFLPLILGLIGIFYQVKNDINNSWVVFLLFFMTGLAIVIYLNQTPYQPRERDYAYAGSFYAFCIWIGLGLLYVVELMQKLMKNKMAAAVVAFILCLSVPTVMAASGWESHSRSDKTSALDWGKNYLSNLPPNAVIFTRGDNDTFPLWYVQEVEGFRTDVRVCNYMLSSGYWYVHQMGRKQYESERLPLSLTPEQYDNGVNEPVFIQEVFEGPIELKDAIEFLKSDNARTKVTLVSGDKANFLPARNLKITVDKDAVIRNGIVPESMKDKIVDEIVWRIPESVGYLYKNDLMLLDFMATNDWSRAVYFTSLSDIRNVLGIDQYLHQEGLSHRFMPVLAEDYHKDAGGVYADGSYKILMDENTRWGNLNKEGVAVDPESRRNILFVKQAYMRLAQYLANRNQGDSAVAVLDRCLEFFPDEKIPFDLYMMAYPEIYYKSGAMEKGDELIRKLVDNSLESLRYYERLDPVFADYYIENIRENLALINEMSNVAAKFKRNELSLSLDDTLEQEFNKFMQYF
ncbi:MAG: DUF2723 domain-containing protein [Lentimicrobiaceae bacterium]|nr:DUF2723 domain-containing protein [Lentimicrobiaceae bacterium]